MMRWGTRLIAATGLFLATLARAQTALPLHIDEAGLFVAEKSPYAALSVSISNPTAKRIAFALSASSMGTGAGIVDLKGLTIEPGGSRQVDIPILGEPYNASVRLTGSNGQTTQQYATAEHFDVLHVAPVRSWATEVQMTDYQTRQGLGASPPSGPAGMYRGGRGMVYRVGGSRSGPAGSKLIRQITPETLPDFWLCLTPFSRIMMDEAVFRALPASQSQAINEWVDAGGELELYSAKRVEQRPQMLGTVFAHFGNPLAGEPGDVVRPIKEQPWRRMYGDEGDPVQSFPHQVRELSGRGGGLALATLFFLVGGPVNHFYFRRRKMPRAILISLPVLSIAFCLAITAYFIVFRGFTRQGGSYSLTIMDESANGGFIFARHAVLSGLYPMGGFHFGPKTAFYPLHAIDPNDSFRIEDTGGINLRSGLFQPSLNFHYATAGPVQTRERLIIDLAAGTAINGFETPIETAVVRSAGGDLFRVDGLEAGAKGNLSPIKLPASGSAVRDPANALWNAYYLVRPADPYARDMRGFAPDEQPDRMQYLIAFSAARPGVDPGVRISKGGRTDLLYGLPESNDNAGEPQP